MAVWTQLEVDLIIADYFSMLLKELSGKPFSKTEHRRSLAPLLNGRPEGSIEFKHQNISAVLVKLGVPYINGYKPRWNYQQLLEERVIDYIGGNKTFLRPKFEHFVDTAAQPTMVNFNRLIVEAPTQEVHEEQNIEYKRRPIKINFLEREQRNASLGSQGEGIAIEYERRQLIEAGKESLADKIEWVSMYDDGAGFDILSKNLNGTDKYIEVKTTKLGKDTPIFFSKNEFEFSKQAQKDYHLYRLFNLSDDPKMFIVNGSFDKFCSKTEPTQYKGFF